MTTVREIIDDKMSQATLGTFSHRMVLDLHRVKNIATILNLIEYQKLQQNLERN